MTYGMLRENLLIMKIIALGRGCNATEKTDYSTRMSCFIGYV